MSGYNYKIGDKQFSQSKLKLGQIKQLLPYFDRIASAFDKDENMTIVDFIDTLKDDISEMIAIVLLEDGKNLKDKDVEKLAEFLDENLEYDTIIDVVADFFTLTPIGLISSRIAQTIGKATKQNNKDKVTG